MAGRIAIKLHFTNQKLRVLVDNLTYQVSFTSFLSATHYREYSKSLSTRSS